MPTDNTFFEVPLEHSRRKSLIVADYFAAWSHVIVAHQLNHGLTPKLCYIDLFCGPGRYGDGTPSTPLLVLERALAHNCVHRYLTVIFNDKDAGNVATLASEVSRLPNRHLLAHDPVFLQEDADAFSASAFSEIRMCPSLVFLDPWGYKGIELGLVNAVIKDWACECICFFNYRRINMGIDNDVLQPRMEMVFGAKRLADLRAAVQGLDPHRREQAIIDHFMAALTEQYGKYVLKFRFRSPDVNATSHFLVFVTKGFLGYDIMKEIMAKQSSANQDGVASFEYDLRDACQLPFTLEDPIGDLASDLARSFRGQRATVEAIYEGHSVGTVYVRKNYRDALLRLEAQGQVSVATPGRKRRRGTMAPGNEIHFL